MPSLLLYFLLRLMKESSLAEFSCQIYFLLLSFQPFIPLSVTFLSVLVSVENRLSK